MAVSLYTYTLIIRRVGGCTGAHRVQPGTLFNWWGMGRIGMGSIGLDTCTRLRRHFSVAAFLFPSGVQEEPEAGRDWKTTGKGISPLEIGL